MAGRVRLASPYTALALGALVLALLALGIAMSIRANQSLSSSDAFVGVAFAVVGVVVAWHQPRNPIGWLLLGGGGFLILSGDASILSVLDYRHRSGHLPLGRLAVLLQPTWAPAIVLMGLSVILFPDGRLPSRRWRGLLWLLLGVGAIWLAGAFGIAVSAIARHDIRVSSGGDLLTVDHPIGGWAWWNVAQIVFFAVLGLSWLAWLAHQIVEFRRSTGERRLQLKWLMAGTSIFVVSGIASVAAGSATGTVGRVVADVAGAGLFALPVTIGFGILKFRLYEIDRIVSRTISYTILTGLLVGVFVGLVVLTTDVLPISSPVGVAASTLGAAALFNPLRQRLQHMVDRRFNRARYDTEAAVAAFTARLRDAVELDTIRNELLDAIDRAVEPAYASLWLKAPPPRSPV